MNGIIDSGTMARTLVVLGAGAATGDGVVEAALAAGRPVVAVGDDAEALHSLAVRHAGAALRTVVQSIASDADAAALMHRLRGLGVAVDGVVAALGQVQPCGRLLDEPAEVLQRTFDQDLLPHLFAARHLFPLLGAGSAGYVLVGGPGGDYPWAGYGHCSIVAAALRMMARVLHDEAAQHGLRVQLLSVEAPLSPCALAKSGDAARKAIEVGRRALARLDGARPTTTLPATIPHATTSVRAATARRTSPSTHDRAVAPEAVLPARDLRAARALLDAIASPTPPGSLHDERC